MKKKVLITGDTGLLGANLCFLWRDVYDIVGVSRSVLGVHGTHHVCLDLSVPEHVRKLICTEKPDVIVHTAALVSVEQCEQNQMMAEQLNTEMVENVAISASDTGAHLIHISTDAFYQNESGVLSQEHHSLSLNNVYTKTKYQGEIKALEYHDTLCLRTNFYGSNLKPEKTSFSEWILRDLHDNKRLTMFSDVLFSPIYVNDLAGIMNQAIKKKLTGIYNAGGNGHISKFDFAAYIKQKFNISAGEIIRTSVSDFPFIAWRSTNMSMDSQKIKMALSIEIPDIRLGVDHYEAQLSCNYLNLLRGTNL